MDQDATAVIVPPVIATDTVAGGVRSLSGVTAPVRESEEPLPDALGGQDRPGRVFGRVVCLDDIPEGYRALNDRAAISCPGRFGHPPRVLWQPSHLR